MTTTASDYLVHRLYDWGVRTVYGYPGDGINGVMGALSREQEKVAFVQARHEEEAAFLACAHAKFTGEVGVCIATSGPGAIHLLNGLYDAKLDHQPVVAIVGQQAVTALGSDYQQEVDLVSLYKDVAHHFVQMASTPAQVRHLVDRAMRIAIAERTVTCVIIPSDVQEMAAVPHPGRKHGSTFTGMAFSAPDIIPKRDDLQRAADILNEGRKVAILVGAGALGASEEVTIVAEMLAAGVAKALLGKAVVPDTLSYVTGCIGLLGTKPSWDLMSDCDTLLMIGSGFPYSEFLPKEGQARGVQIDISPRMLGLRYPMEVNLQGDAKLTLRALVPLLKKKTDRQWRDTIEQNVREWWETLEARAMVPANPINPQRLFWELSSRLPDRAIITCDSGSAANWYARDIKIRSGMMTSLSGGLATMCNGLPYAIAAKRNHPDRPVIALVGDGAMQMQGINNLITIANNWKSWSNPRFVILVLNNRDLNMVTWEQRVFLGDGRFEKSEDVPEFPYARYAEMLGLQGIELSNPEMIVSAWGTALMSDKPVVIDAHCDPDVPPLPPHISMDQAKGFLSALFKDPGRSAILSQSVKQAMSPLLHKKG
jgi:pyruvate dehydrogenase (quinone)